MNNAGVPRSYRMKARRRGVEQTRERIVAAALDLQAERGAVATSWEEIGRRAGVSTATVYRHFASLEELVPACARSIFDAIGIVSADQVESVYAGATTPWQKLERYIRGTCDCYARGDGWLHAARREAELVPALGDAVGAQQASNEVFVRTALEGRALPPQATSVITALTDFPFWRSLTHGGLSHQQAVEVICGLVHTELRKCGLED
jgi:AcrR family transcriptional regulator